MNVAFGAQGEEGEKNASRGHKVAIITGPTQGIEALLFGAAHVGCR